jgi:hypothetical protein
MLAAAWRRVRARNQACGEAASAASRADVARRALGAVLKLAAAGRDAEAAAVLALLAEALAQAARRDARIAALVADLAGAPEPTTAGDVSRPGFVARPAAAV